MLDHLAEERADEVCDHTPRLPDARTASLATFGGYCDCEVLANVDPNEIF